MGKEAQVLERTHAAGESAGMMPVGQGSPRRCVDEESSSKPGQSRDRLHRGSFDGHGRRRAGGGGGAPVRASGAPCRGGVGEEAEPGRVGRGDAVERDRVAGVGERVAVGSGRFARGRRSARAAGPVVGAVGAAGRGVPVASDEAGRGEPAGGGAAPVAVRGAGGGGARAGGEGVRSGVRGRHGHRGVGPAVRARGAAVHRGARLLAARGVRGRAVGEREAAAGGRRGVRLEGPAQARRGAAAAEGRAGVGALRRGVLPGGVRGACSRRGLGPVDQRDGSQQVPAGAGRCGGPAGAWLGGHRQGRVGHLGALPPFEVEGGAELCGGAAALAAAGRAAARASR